MVTGSLSFEAARVKVDYDHAVNRHTLDSPRAIIPLLFGGWRPRSLLDVGCGPGMWLKAAREYGIDDVLGLDGIADANARGLIPAELFRLVDLGAGWNLGRTFDVALCLEVAEHLDPEAGPSLVEALTRHSPRIVFSAACPGQPGQHHVNCRWPSYWQELFNARGFACSDDIRWRIWNDSGIEPWYRQNMFVASRDGRAAGNEPRINAVVHPAMVEHLAFAATRTAVADAMAALQGGSMPLTWYAASACRAAWAKLRRRLGLVLTAEASVANRS